MGRIIYSDRSIALEMENAGRNGNGKFPSSFLPQKGEKREKRVKLSDREREREIDAGRNMEVY